MNASPRHASAPLVLLAAVLLIACEENVVAITGTDYPYSMWGVLNPLADTQFVRVFPVEDALEPGEPAPLDARFVSTDLESSDEHQWRDSVFVDARDVVGHVFYAPLTVEYGRSYRIEITGAHERASWAEVEVPAKTNLTLSEPDTSRGIRLPGFVGGGPPRLVKSELVVAVSYVMGFTANGCPLFRNVEHVIPFDGRLEPGPERWSFEVNLHEVYAYAASQAEDDPAYIRAMGIMLGYMRFRTIVANEAWNPPGDVFDPNVLVQPGQMENVENGFGFIAAGYRLSSQWNLAPRFLRGVGFRTEQPEC